VFEAAVNPADVNPQGGDDASEARWFPLSDLPPLAFDHSEILEKWIKRNIK
jgi:8-oxo-dGTP diphosphatase